MHSLAPRKAIWALAPALAAMPLCAGGAPAGPAATLTEMRVNRAEEEVFLFALRLDDATLSATFPGFPAKDGFLVPLGELCRLLDLAIQATPTRGRAEGFFVEEKRSFSLDVLAGTVVVEGRKQTFDRSQVELHEDDIYVDTRLLAAWLPLDLLIARRSATITVSPRVTLPIQEHWRRERMIGQFRAQEGPKAFKAWPDPYRPAEVPMLDETLRLTAQSDPGSDRRVQAQSTTFITGDLLGLSTSVYTNLDASRGLSDFRMTMGRRDPHGELLGPLKATEFAFGDILNPGLALVTMPMAGTGALLTNYPLQREITSDRHSFRGSLPPGWQVEIYRNQALLGFQSSRPDGRYEFLNVPLYFGWNDFRLVFYGPQGQRREEVARFDVSENQTPEGVFQYRVVSTDPHPLGRRGQFEARYGISKQLSVGVAFSEANLEGRRHGYTQASLQGSWSLVGATLTGAQDQLGGSISELVLRSRIGSTSLTARHADLQGGFVSEVFSPSWGPVKSRSGLETSTLMAALGSQVTFDLGGAQDHLVAGGSVDRVYNRISTSLLGYFLSNEITHTAGRGLLIPFASTTMGDLLASKFFQNFSLRGQASYQFDGPHRLNTLSAFVESPFLKPFNLQAGLTRSLASGDTQVQLGAQKTQGTYALGVSLRYSTQSRFSLDFTLRMGFAQEPRSRRIDSQAQGFATNGAISARAFLDLNGNGVLDPGEKPIQGVGFMVNGSAQPVTTGADGVAFLTNLFADLDANLSVNSSTLEDPLMRPATAGLRITPRTGHVVVLDVPLALFGEITGSVFLRRDGTNRELAGLMLELVDQNGKTVKATRTSFDGFYTLLDLPPGTYRLRASESELRRLGLAPMPPRVVIISPEGTLLDGLELVFAPDPAASSNPQVDDLKKEHS